MTPIDDFPEGTGLLHEYRVSRWLGMSRRSALWDLRPMRLRAIFALLHGNPVAYRLVIGKDGSALTFEPDIHGAIVMECHVYGDNFRRPPSLTPVPPFEFVEPNLSS